MNHDDKPDYVEYLKDTLDTTVHDGKLYVSMDSLTDYFDNLNHTLIGVFKSQGTTPQAFGTARWLFENIYGCIDTAKSIWLFDTIPDYIPVEFYGDESETP